MHQDYGLDQPAIYRITVRGYLTDRWSDWFEGMTITVERAGDGPPVTTLTGVVADQAALQGILRALYTLGLPVCSVTYVSSHIVEHGDSEQR